MIHPYHKVNSATGLKIQILGTCMNLSANYAELRGKIWKIIYSVTLVIDYSYDKMIKTNDKEKYIENKVVISRIKEREELAI